jgi:hypothetical protein
VGRSSKLLKGKKLENDQKFFYIFEGHFQIMEYIFIIWKLKKRKRKKVTLLILKENKEFIIFKISKGKEQKFINQLKLIWKNIGKSSSLKQKKF